MICCTRNCTAAAQVLIFDGETKAIISPLLSVPELRALGVTLHMQVRICSEPSSFRSCHHYSSSNSKILCCWRAAFCACLLTTYVILSPC